VAVFPGIISLSRTRNGLYFDFRGLPCPGVGIQDIFFYDYVNVPARADFPRINKLNLMSFFYMNM